MMALFQDGPLSAVSSTLVSILLASLGVFLVIRYFKETYSVFHVLNIPGPKPALLFGNSLAFKSKFVLDVFSDWYRQYGKVFGYYEGLRPSLVVTEPEMIKEILGKQFNKFQDRTDCVPFLYWPDNINITNARGSQWKRERAVIGSAFNSMSLREMGEEVIDVANKFVNILDSTENLEKSVDISDWADRYAVDSFAQAAFGFPGKSLDSQGDLLLQFMRATFRQGDIDNPVTGIARLFPSMVPFLKLFNGEYEHIHKQHLENVRQLIKQSKREFQVVQPAKRNLLGSLLAASHEGLDNNNNISKRSLTEDELLSQVHGLLGAGFGQTNNLLSFLCYNLAKYPDVQDEVRAEVAREVSYDGETTYDTLGKLEYLDMVMYETLRTFPIAPGVTRICNETCEISGITIPEGMTIRLMASPMYSDSDIYPEPATFDPHRFSTEEKSRRHAQSFLAMGYGPRMCVGWRLGMLQCKAAIARILSNYTIRLDTERPMETTLRPMLCPKNGVWVYLQRRQISHRLTQSEE